MRRISGLVFKQSTIIFLLAVLLGLGQAARAENILYIGNSFTHEGPVPRLVHDLAVDAGEAAPFYEFTAPGGSSLADHVLGNRSSSAVGLINQGIWDVCWG